MRTKRISIVVAVLVVLGLVALVVIVNLKRAFDLHEYAIANDCTWTWQGTAYGDDRDYMCK